MQQLIIFICIFLCCFSCVPNPSIIEFDVNKVNEETILPTCHFSWSPESPGKFIYKDSSLFILKLWTKKEQFCVHNFRTNTTYNYFKMGRGPGEVLGLIDFCITNDGVVILHDISTNRFIMCSSAKLATGIFVTSDAESISLSNIPDVYTICSGEGSYYVSGYNDKERLFSLDTCLKYSNSFQYSPTNNHKLDHIINEAYCGNICYSDKHNSVILACRYADQIEVTNIYSGLSFIIKSRDGYQPDYQLVGGKLAHNDGEHSCYTDVRVRGDNIYALYNGSQISSYNSGQKSEIRVFSIKGNLLRRIVLNDAVKHFDFGDDDVIYASSEKGIFQYNI